MNRDHLLGFPPVLLGLIEPYQEHALHTSKTVPGLWHKPFVTPEDEERARAQDKRLTAALNAPMVPVRASKPSLNTRPEQISEEVWATRPEGATHYAGIFSTGYFWYRCIDANKDIKDYYQPDMKLWKRSGTSISINKMLLL